MEIRWVVALFEWVDRVQTYYHANTEWQYMTALYEFIDGGMQDTSFLEAVNRIVASGCHLSSCDIAIKSDKYRYGFERLQNVLNILRLVFDLPVGGSTSSDTISPPLISEPAITNLYVNLEVLQQLFPTAKPTVSPTEAVLTNAPTESPLEFKNTIPTSSPVEFSNITVYNDGGKYIVDENVSFADGESLVITDKTSLILNGGSVVAPTNSEWPAIRLSVGSKINGTAGYVKGSDVDDNFNGGGEAIQLNNGQSSSATAGFGEFYELKVVGGNGRIGGDSLVVNGFGTEAIIYGGEFIGGTGNSPDLNGYSIRVINSATVHIHGGTFIGDIKVEGNGIVYLYGCFRQNDTEVSGLFAGDVETNITIDGDVEFMPVSEQECDTIPSVAPTSFPTVSPPPTTKSLGIQHSTHLILIVFQLGVGLHILFA
jgi:hypothetical protein